MLRRPPRWWYCVALAAAAVSSSADASEPPADWRSGQAYELSLAAEAARASGLFEQCMENDEASIALEDRTSTRVHMAGCADRLGKVLVALRQMQPVLEGALKAHDAQLAELARLRVEQLLRRLGSLTISAPSTLAGLVVTIDGAAVQTAALAKPIAVDPGKHRVHADGTLDGRHADYDEIVTLADGERRTVAIALRSSAPDFLTPGQLACMQLAHNQQEVMQCLPGPSRPLVVRAALEGSIYGDTFAVRILNPAVRASVSSPTNGWNVAASYLVDFVSAASPDIVSTASPRGSDTRHAASVSGGYKPAQYGFEAGASVSSESDYVSRSGSIAVLGDFYEKRVTPRLGWSLSVDTIGRGGTPYDVFSNSLIANEASAGASFVLSPTTVVIAGATAAFERGDQSKPYRLIPMFAPGVEVPRGAGADEVNAKRLAVRPYEQLPLDRDRYTLGGRLNHRFAGSTLRIDERLYDDSWQIVASSTDVRFLVDIGSRVTFGPHARLHAQTGASFHQRVYHAETSPTVIVPLFRTTDRELSPLVSTTGGASAWWKISDSRDGVGLMVYASADALYSVYLDSIYATNRLAGYGTIGIEAELE